MGDATHAAATLDIDGVVAMASMLHLECYCCRCCCRRVLKVSVSDYQLIIIHNKRVKAEKAQPKMKANKQGKRGKRETANGKR